MHQNFLCALWVSIGLCGSAIAGSAPYAVVQSIEGSAAQIELERPDGFKQVAAIGTELPQGTKVTTHEATLKVRFEDQSELKIAPQTQLLIFNTQAGQITSQLDHGHVRALVSKPENQSNPTPKARFFIRTKTASMGARGTDFTVASSPQGVEVRTREGVVEVAPIQGALAQAPLHTLGAGDGVNLNLQNQGTVFKFPQDEYDSPKSHPSQADPLADTTGDSWFKGLWRAIKNALKSGWTQLRSLRG